MLIQKEGISQIGLGTSRYHQRVGVQIPFTLLMIVDFGFDLAIHEEMAWFELHQFAVDSRLRTPVRHPIPPAAL